MRLQAVIALIAFSFIFLADCSGGQNQVHRPVRLKPFKEISAIEIFEDVLAKKGYRTIRKQPIYIVGYGQWKVDLWVEGDRLPLVIEYLTEGDRTTLGERMHSSKVGDKFKLIAVAVRELKKGESLNLSNSRFAVVFDDRDYLYQPNPSSEDRYDITIFEIKRRLRKDIVDVIEELERQMAKQSHSQSSGGG